MRRSAKLLLLLLALGLVGLGFFAMPLWSWIITRTDLVGFPNEVCQGTGGVHRWYGTRHGRTILFYRDTGFQATDSAWENGTLVRATWWHRDGRVSYQRRLIDGGDHEDRYLPPWWWGVDDHSRPTSRWWKVETPTTKASSD